MSTQSQLPPSTVRMFRPFPTIEAAGLLTRQMDRAEITYAVKTAETTDFFNIVCGLPELVGGAILRVVPLQHPEYPWMLADSFRAERQLWEGSFYGWSFVTVMFRSPTWDLDGAQAFLTIRQLPAGRWLQCQAPLCLFTDGTTHPTTDPGIWVPGTDLSITVHQLPRLPNTAAMPIQKCVNDAPLWDWATGTVMYQAPGLVRSTSMAGITTYEVDQRLQQSSIPWNQEFKPDGTLDDVFINGVLRYPLVDFSPLFA